MTWLSHFGSESDYKKQNSFMVAAMQNKASSGSISNISREYNYIMYFKVPELEILKSFRIKNALTPLWYQMEAQLYEEGADQTNY